jgi:hypothetical protein
MKVRTLFVIPFLRSVGFAVLEIGIEVTDSAYVSQYDCYDPVGPRAEALGEKVTTYLSAFVGSAAGPVQEILLGMRALILTRSTSCIFRTILISPTAWST